MAGSRWSLAWARPGVVRALSVLGCGGVWLWACASGVDCRVSWCPGPGSGVSWGSRTVDWVWGGGAVFVSPVSCVSLLRPSSRLPPFVLVWRAPCPAPSVGGPPVIPSPHVVLPAVPCSRGCVPVTWCLSPPSCRGPSLCTFPSWCPRGGVVAGSVGRRSPTPGVRLSGAISGGFRACRGRGGRFPVPLTAWHLRGRSHWGWRGCG